MSLSSEAYWICRDSRTGAGEFYPQLPGTELVACHPKCDKNKRDSDCHLPLSVVAFRRNSALISVPLRSFLLTSPRLKALEALARVTWKIKAVIVLEEQSPNQASQQSHLLLSPLNCASIKINRLKS